MPDKPEQSHSGQEKFPGAKLGDDELNVPVEIIDPNQLPGHKEPRSKLPKYLLILLGVIIFAAAAGLAGWKLLKKFNSSQTEPNASQQINSDNTGQTGGGKQPLSEEYSSSQLLIDFKYPSSWEVAEENGAIFVKSPNFRYSENEGGEVSGVFKIYIKKGAEENDGKYLGRGYAIGPSEKLQYSNPASGQRKETFVTAFGLDKPDNFSYFVVQGNFNLKKGETLGPKFASEQDAFLIAGGFASDDLKDALETNPISVDYYKSDQNYLTAIEIIKTIRLR